MVVLIPERIPLQLLNEITTFVTIAVYTATSWLYAVYLKRLIWRNPLIIDRRSKKLLAGNASISTDQADQASVKPEVHALCLKSLPISHHAPDGVRLTEDTGWTAWVFKPIPGARWIVLLTLCHKSSLWGRGLIKPHRRVSSICNQWLLYKDGVVRPMDILLLLIGVVSCRFFRNRKVSKGNRME